jgi:hypothetical protein
LEFGGVGRRARLEEKKSMRGRGRRKREVNI